MKPLPALFALALFACPLASAQQDDAADPRPSGKPLVPTEIVSVSMMAETRDETAYLIFSGSVKLTSTNLELTCDQLEIFTDLKEQEEGKEAETIGNFSSIQKIIASGNVKIVQEERTATAGRAEVLPQEDVIMLDQNPMVFQGEYTMDGTGAQLLIHRGNGKVEMIGSESNKISITGPAIQDFGFEQNDESIIPADGEAADDAKSENSDKN